MTAGFDRLADRLRRFADACEDRSPLYAHLARHAADDPEVAGLLVHAPTDNLAHPTLLFAAVHDLVLRGHAPRLAPWDPSADGRRGLGDDPWPTFRATVLGWRHGLDAVGASRDLDRIGMESGGLVPGTARDRVARSWLGRSTGRAGQRHDEVLAAVDDHGRWVRWEAPVA